MKCVLANVQFSVKEVENISMQPLSGGALQKKERGKIPPVDRMDGWTLYPAYWRLHTINCTLYTLFCKLYPVYCIFYTVHCTLHAANFKLYTTRCTVCTDHCMLHTVHWCLWLVGKRVTSYNRLHWAIMWWLLLADKTFNVYVLVIDRVENSLCHVCPGNDLSFLSSDFFTKYF